MPFTRGRFKASAEGKKDGITLLVPKVVVDAEQDEFMSHLTGGKVQNLIVFLRRGGLRHCDINDIIKRGEHKGFCPLHVAVLKGTSSVVSAVLELGDASANVRTAKTNETPLHLAARMGEVGMTRALLQYGAEAEARDASRRTPLLVAAATPTTSKTYHHVVAGELVKGGASLTARDENGDTPLHLACDTPLALPLVFEMLKHGKALAASGLREAVEALNIHGEGVLHRACAKQQSEVAALLLDAGARSDARAASGDTAMHCAARAGLEEIAMHLLDEANELKALNASNLAGETPLHLAMSHNSARHARIARELLARGAFAFGRTRSGESVMHACAREGNVALAGLILSRQTQATADALNARAMNGQTPLHVAVAMKQDKMTRMLLEQENIDRGVADNEGHTAVHVACISGDVALLGLLLKAGRGVRPEELSVRNALGWAALHTCAFHGHQTALKMLLTWKAPADLRTCDGWTALHLAASEGQLMCVRSLLASGASLDAEHPSGESALGLAASRGRQQVLRELLRAGASPAAPADEYGWTPMHAALQRGDEDCALALLEKGGKVRSKHDVAPPPVGDPIDLADAALRSALLEADQKRRNQNRRDGRDSDDGNDDGWQLQTVDNDPLMRHWPAPPSYRREERSQLMLPTAPYQPRVNRPDRSGLFGYFGDIRDVREEIQSSKQTFLAVPTKD